jgi:hypothetical protein
MALTGSSIASTYLKLLRANSDTMGADATASYIQDSADTDSALSISTTRVGIGTAAPTADFEIKMDTDKHILFSDSQGETGNCPTIHTVNTAGSALVDLGFRADNFIFASGNVGIGITPLATFHAKMASDVNFTLSANSGDLRINAVNDAVDTAVGLEFNAADFEFITGTVVLASAQTSGKYLNMEDTTLTTGNLIQAYSNASNTSTRSLVKIVNDHVDATGTTGLLIQQDSTGPAIDAGAGYMVNEQGRQDHVANTMPAPYYRFDGVNDVITVGENANIKFGTGDVTISVLVRTPSTIPAYWAIGDQRDDSSNEMTMQYTTATSELRAYFFIGASFFADSATTSVTLVAETWYNFVWVFNNGVSNALYVNGVSQALSNDVTTGGDFDIAGGWRLGLRGASYYEQSIASFRLFNNALTATEVKELYSGASVPFKYKGANQTDVVSGWTFSSGWTGTGAASITDADTFTTSGSGGIYSTQSLTAGKQYSITIDMTISAGTLIFQAGTSGTVYKSGLTDGSTTFEFTQPIASGSGNLYIKTSGAATVDVTTFSLTQIGAVAEYDGSSAGAHQWGDKSGNDLHGTVGDGAGGATAPTLENTPYDSGTEYEEGTWSPVVKETDDGNTMTQHAGAGGTYTKIGNMVHISAVAQTTNLNSASGEIKIAGLPFVVRNDTDSYGGIAVGNAEGLNITSSETVGGQFVLNSSEITLRIWNHAGGCQAMTAAEWSDNGEIKFSATYTAVT